MAKVCICVPVCASTIELMERQLSNAAVYADVIEIRLDCLENWSGSLKELPLTLKSVLSLSNKPLLLTLRSPEQGGKSDISLEDRLAFWESSPAAHLVDLEEDIADQIDAHEAVVVVSHHDFSSVPDDLTEIFDRLSATQADVVKIAIMTHDAVDAIPLWKLLDKCGSVPKDFIPVAMGEAGKWTRILGPAYGAYLTYAALSQDVSTAQGQITAREMHEVYRVKELTPGTSVYGVIGDPVSSSLSPYFQNAAFKNAGLDAVFIPLLVKDLRSFIDRMVRRATSEVDINFRGFSVTMPHKMSVIDLLDEVDPSAAVVGAVNTISVEDDRLIGYNTDVQGFLEPLRQRYNSLADKRVAVFGSGGAAMACLYGLSAEGAEVDIYVRDVQKTVAAELMKGTRVNHRSAFVEHSKQRPYDLVVNATPLGMKGPWENSSILSQTELEGIGAVYDLVTSPAQTVLMKMAAGMTVPVISGLEMLIAQGALQFKIWTGREPSVSAMRDAVNKRIG